MRADQLVAASFRFLLVFTRASAVFTFLPIPGFRAGPDAARLLAALALTVVLFPVSPAVAIPSAGTLVLWLIQELCLGVTVGVALSFLAEAMQIAAQMAGLQAGFAFASTIDPVTQADSPVLGIFTQLLSGMLFFCLGLHREVIIIFVQSIRRWPPGSYFISSSIAEGVWRLGAAMFSMSLRLAMPVIALLFIVDVAFAVVGKINAQLHLLSLAFPAKMLAGVGILSITLVAAPLLFENFAAQITSTLVRMVAR